MESLWINWQADNMEAQSDLWQEEQEFLAQDPQE